MEVFDSRRLHFFLMISPKPSVSGPGSFSRVRSAPAVGSRNADLASIEAAHRPERKGIHPGFVLRLVEAGERGPKTGHQRNE
jgi:hypothetical protein